MAASAAAEPLFGLRELFAILTAFLPRRLDAQYRRMRARAAAFIAGVHRGLRRSTRELRPASARAATPSVWSIERNAFNASSMR